MPTAEERLGYVDDKTWTWLRENTRKDALYKQDWLVYPEEVNGKYGWASWSESWGAVRITGFDSLVETSANYVDVYWQVEPVDCPDPAFDPENYVYILGCTYVLEEDGGIDFYRSWRTSKHLNTSVQK